jgi:hypothetical protein
MEQTGGVPILSTELDLSRAAAGMKRLMVGRYCLGDRSCSVCLEDLQKAQVTFLPCGHHIHSGCFRRFLEKGVGDPPKCPSCRQEVTQWMPKWMRAKVEEARRRIRAQEEEDDEEELEQELREQELELREQELELREQEQELREQEEEEEEESDSRLRRYGVPAMEWVAQLQSYTVRGPRETPPEAGEESASDVEMGEAAEDEDEEDTTFDAVAGRQIQGHIWPATTLPYLLSAQDSPPRPERPSDRQAIDAQGLGWPPVTRWPFQEAVLPYSAQDLPSYPGRPSGPQTAPMQQDSGYVPGHWPSSSEDDDNYILDRSRRRISI